MKEKLRQQLRRRNRKLNKRIDKRRGVFRSPMMRTTNTKYELAEKQHAVHCGGIGMIMQLVKQLDLRKIINRGSPVLKLHMPYDEADHVLNIAFNLLAGGTCLDHLEQRRTDEAYLNALGAERIPDPTTAGDFCRRFDEPKLLALMEAINAARQKVWQQQDEAFFTQATLEADGSMVETCGEKKEGIGINYKGQWGYHPLIISLAETQETLYLANRSGNRPSHEDAADYFNRAIRQCRLAGFLKILLRGDTDFSLTEHLDGWDDDGVHFVFGYDACKNLTAQAESLTEDAWKPLDRGRPQPEKPRAKRPNYKEQIVVENGYKNQKLCGESYAEFEYRPTKCNRSYRMIVLRKQIEVTRGQQLLFNQPKYFFYITNEPAAEKPAREIIRDANCRCNQENTISQLKACRALAAPLDNLHSNWAYMVIASLAWTLKVWSGLMVRVQGNPAQRKQRKSIRDWVLKMEFGTYLNCLMQIPAQIIRSARQSTYRLLTYRPDVDRLLTIHDHIARPLRC